MSTVYEYEESESEVSEEELSEDEVSEDESSEDEAPENEESGNETPVLDGVEGLGLEKLHLTSFPNEVLEEILARVPYTEENRYSIAHVSHRFADVSTKATYYKLVAEQQLPILFKLYPETHFEVQEVLEVAGDTYGKAYEAASQHLVNDNDSKPVRAAILYGTILLDHWATFRTANASHNCSLLELARRIISEVGDEREGIYSKDALMCMRLAMQRGVDRIGPGQEPLDTLSEAINHHSEEILADMHLFQAQRRRDWAEICDFITARATEAAYLLDDVSVTMSDKINFSRSVCALADKDADKEHKARSRLQLILCDFGLEVSERSVYHALSLLSLFMRAIVGDDDPDAEAHAEPSVVENSIQWRLLDCPELDVPASTGQPFLANQVGETMAEHIRRHRVFQAWVADLQASRQTALDIDFDKIGGHLLRLSRSVARRRSELRGRYCISWYHDSNDEDPDVYTALVTDLCPTPW